MPRAWKICSCGGCTAHNGSCTEPVPSGRCTPCQTAADERRGTAHQRGYDHRHEHRFRAGVLRKHPLCQCTDTHDTHCAGLAPSVAADHHPRDRRELIRLGLDPNDPRHGRGLCTPCHGWHTAQSQPGGWHAL